MASSNHRYNESVTDRGRDGSSRARQNGSSSRRSSSSDRSRSRGQGGSYGYGEEHRPSGRRRKRKKRKRRIVMFVLELLVLVVLGLVLWAVLKQTSTQKINVDEEEIVISMNEGVAENETLLGYRNIALFGIDARDGSLGKGNRSDTIIIASINQDTGDVKLLSVYRDTYLNLSNDSYNKCNAAYAYGGPEQAILMLNANLDLNITDYVTVGFDGLIEAIDCLGGVEIDVQEEEISHLNNYQASMYSTESNEVITENYTKVTTAGLQTLNGLQATAYCRIRYTTGDDFKRAERQRTVIMACLEKAKEASLTTLNATLDAVLPYVSTSLSTTEMLEVLSDIADYNIVDEDGFPFADTRTTGRVGSAGSCVIPITLETNVVLLHEFLFDVEDYEPSSQVVSYSAKIASDTGYS